MKLIHIWIWFPIYFLLPLSFYVSYLIGIELGLKGSVLINYTINPFKTLRGRRVVASRRTKTIMNLLSVFSFSWIGIGFVLFY